MSKWRRALIDRTRELENLAFKARQAYRGSCRSRVESRGEEAMSESHPGENNCPLNECTGDGTYVGRCWFWCEEGKCPRHGDVSAALKLYRETGKLTKEEPTWLR